MIYLVYWASRLRSKTPKSSFPCYMCRHYSICSPNSEAPNSGKWRNIATESQGNTLHQLHSTLPTNGDNHVTQSLGCKTSFTIGEIILKKCQSSINQSRGVLDGTPPTFSGKLQPLSLPCCHVPLSVLVESWTQNSP